MPNESIPNDGANRNLAVALRPQSFDQFIGSASIVNQIRSQLRGGSIPTAILLSGPSGCGKTTLARIINTELDGELLEANAADDTGVDAARALGESAQFRPQTGTKKVINVDECHQLTKQAQNALLKHVEDAPESTIWIFCTTEPSKIIPTLRGRCVSFTLAGLTGDQVRALVCRAFNHLGYQTYQKHDAAKTIVWHVGIPFLGKTLYREIKDEEVAEFIKNLVRENVTSPRAILMATERFIGGMDPLGAIFGTQDAPQAFEIARAAAKGDWKSVRLALSKAGADEAMAIRAVVVNYFKSILLNEGGDVHSTAILELTATVPFDGPLGLAELSSRLYRICKPRTY